MKYVITATLSFCVLAFTPNYVTAQDSPDDEFSNPIPVVVEVQKGSWVVTIAGGIGLTVAWELAGLILDSIADDLLASSDFKNMCIDTGGVHGVFKYGKLKRGMQGGGIVGCMWGDESDFVIAYLDEF